MSTFNININYFLYLFVIPTVIVFCILIASSEDTSLSNIFLTIPKIVAVDGFLFYLFTAFAWKWKIFRNWLVPFPNLNGTWRGTIHSTWVDDKTGQSPPPIPAILTIKQSFLHINCVMRTAEMTSRSITASFVLIKEQQLKQLYYSYDSNPLETIKDRSPQHCGTMVFDIHDNPENWLSGRYWTGRKTTGQIEMEFWRKERIDRYPSELGEHPVSKLRSV